jgi:hypothetical protein
MKRMRWRIYAAQVCRLTRTDNVRLPFQSCPEFALQQTKESLGSEAYSMIGRIPAPFVAAVADDANRVARVPFGGERAPPSVPI